MPTKKEDEDFKMHCDLFDLKIEKADSSEIVVHVVFKDKKIPLGEMRKLEDAIRKILEACGRLEGLQPSKR